MRRRLWLLPADVWLCLALSMLVAWGTGAIAERVAQAAYEKEVAAHAPVPGEIGGPAGEEVFRAQSIDDLLSHETFTVISPGIEYRNRGAGFYEGRAFYMLTLPSGELVAAWINGESVQSLGSDLFSGDNILPVGRVVYEDLTSSETFLDQIEYAEPLSRHDFYVDMVGDTAVLARDEAVETPKSMVQVLTVVVVFPLLHLLGSKLGIFPAYFSLKKKREPEWE